jgi:hypothetical protein
LRTSVFCSDLDAIELPSEDRSAQMRRPRSQLLRDAASAAAKETAMKLISRIASSAGGCALLAATAAACGSQAGPNYQGDSLAKVTGVVVSELSNAADAPDAVVLANWGQVGAMFAPGGDTVDVTGDFPAEFTLSLFEPPPDDILYNPANDIAFDQGHMPFDAKDESRIALGRIVAVAKDQHGEPDPSHVIGGAEQHALVYVEKDMKKDSYGALLFHSALKAGFHLLSLAQRSNEDNQPILDCEVAAKSDEEWIDCGLNSILHPADADERVTVRLVDSDAELNFPSYYPVYLVPGTDVGAQPECGDPMNPCMDMQ